MQKKQQKKNSIKKSNCNGTCLTCFISWQRAALLLLLFLFLATSFIFILIFIIISLSHFLIFAFCYAAHFQLQRCIKLLRFCFYLLFLHIRLPVARVIARCFYAIVRLTQAHYVKLLHRSNAQSIFGTNLLK